MHEISCTKYHAIGRIFFKRNLVNVIYQQSCNSIFFKFKSKVRVYVVRISRQPVQLYTSRVAFL